MGHDDNPYTSVRKVPGETDACDVEVAAGNVIFVFHVTRLFLSRRKLESHVAVDWRSTEGIDRRSVGLPLGTLPPTNIDWRSNSSLDTQRKRLQDYYEPDKKMGFPWMQIIQWAAQRVDQFVHEAGDLEIPDYVEAIRPEYIIQPIFPASRRPTVWFGQGETMKGQTYIGAAVAACYGRNFANLQTKELRRGVVVVDYEDDFNEFSVRVSRAVNSIHMQPPGNLRRFDPRGHLFVDVVEQLKAKIEADGGADAIFVDSAIPACGGDVNDPEPVGAFFSALSWIGLPALIIAHETKAGNDEFPFGSQVWRTQASMNVNFQSGEERKTLDGLYVRDLLLRCTKANNVRRFSPLAFHVFFTDDEATDSSVSSPRDMTLAKTWLSQIDPSKVSVELVGKLPPLRRLVAFLKDSPDQPLKEIAKGTGLDEKMAYNLMVRNPSTFQPEGGGKGRGNAATWRVIEGESA